MAYQYEHPHPAVTTDIAVFGIDRDQLQVLLIKRGEVPFKGEWALPGGFLRPDETLEQCARRELAEETSTGSSEVFLTGVYSRPDRDPRERVVTVAYAAMVHVPATAPRGGSDSDEARFWSLDALPPLAFDHATILADSLAKARSLAASRPLAAGLLPHRFTLAELQSAQETLLGTRVDKRNFRRMVLDDAWVTETGEERRGNHRPAAVYQVSK